MKYFIKKVMFKYCILIILVFGITNCQNNYKLPGSNMNEEEAIKNSMLIPLSKTVETKYKEAVIGLFTAIENPVEPDQLVIDSCYFYQKFKVTEKISGEMDSEIQCSYITLVSQKEQTIKKNSSFILILGEEKVAGKYHLLKALEDTKTNRDNIKTGIENLSYLINFSK
jgi:hypothetical protein